MRAEQVDLHIYIWAEGFDLFTYNFGVAGHWRRMVSTKRDKEGVGVYVNLLLGQRRRIVNLLLGQR
eukprot:5242875-Amphidinium_carterae.1